MVRAQATSLALQEYPELNAHVNPECTEVVHRASHNIGVAMDTPKGLIVPNVKNVQVCSGRCGASRHVPCVVSRPRCLEPLAHTGTLPLQQNLTLFEIANELNRMQELASAGRLGEAELKDGTFTYVSRGRAERLHVATVATVATVIVAPP